MPTRFSFLITCEHASAAIPEPYVPVLGEFVARCEAHQLSDTGTAEIGTFLGKLLDAPVFSGKHSRLLVDLNRSLTNPSLFSPPIRELPDKERARILLDYYYPFRHEVLGALERLSTETKPIFHISVHSFTPVFHGEKRRADYGILFDPSREWERKISELWLYYLSAAEPERISLPNYPYQGVSDGHVTTLRRVYRRQPYIGIEIEFNQALPLIQKPEHFARLFVKTLQRALTNKRIAQALFDSV